jgi:hypothetical protein
VIGISLVFAAFQIAAGSLFLLAIGLRNPRVMLQDFPEDVQRAVPPKTPAERRETVYWTVPFALVLFGLPLAAAIVARQQQPDLSLLGAFLVPFVALVLFNLFDLLVVDWLLFCTVRPSFMALPGTEGMAGYRDYGLHFRGFLIGIGISLVASALIAAVTLLLPV